MSNSTTVTDTQDTAAPVVPSREAYDLAIRIIGNLFELMALSFDPRVDDWNDLGSIVHSTAHDLANAYPLKLADKGSAASTYQPE